MRRATSRERPRLRHVRPVDLRLPGGCRHTTRHPMDLPRLRHRIQDDQAYSLEAVAELVGPTRALGFGPPNPLDLTRGPDG